MILSPTLTLSAGSGAAIVRPTFSRDFAGERTLNNGTGPAIAFTRGSDATYFDADGVLQTAANDVPRFDHSQDGAANSLGLLIEEARTNSIRNSQGGGAVVGAPGTVPTNWFIGAASGVSTEIVATDTENGLAYVDVKFTGTNSSGGNVFPNLFFDTSTTVVASSGQTWTGSFFTKIVAGSTAGLTSINIQFVELTAAGAVVATANAAFTPTSSLARYSATRTLTGATTERVYARFICTLPNGAQIGGSATGLTLRFAAPQLEQGAFPTSYIPTTSAAVTRSADSAVVTPISGFYNASEGTLFAEASNFGDGTNTTSVAFNEDNNANERFQLRVRGGGLSVVAAGVISAGTSNIAPATNVASKKAGAAKLNDFAISTNGGAVETDTAGNMPSVTHLVVGALATSLVQPLNGHIRKVAYYPKRLTNTLLEQLTT